MPLCSPSDLYAYGVPRGSTPNPGRVCAEFETNVVVLDVHGFDADDAVIFRPAGESVMPTGLTEGTTYYASPISESAFGLKSAPGGSAVVFSASQDPVLAIAPLPVAAAIAWAEQILFDSLPAHVVAGLEAGAVPVPEILRMTCAELAAGKLLSIMGAASTSLADTVDRATKRLERWGKGIPLRTTDAPAQTNLAAAATAPYNDRSGWQRFGGL